MRQEYRICEDLIHELIFEHPVPALYATKQMLDIIEKDHIVGAHIGKSWFYAQQICFVSLSYNISLLFKH